jgi:hypothetical protein
MITATRATELSVASRKATDRAGCITMLVAFALLAGGCEHAERTARAREDASRAQQIIMEELHIPAVIHVRVYTGTDGNRCDVTVRLAGSPLQQSVVELKREVARIIGKTFRDEVTSLQISI